MADRKPIPKKLRFEVFKRDNFTCQYCGKMAPDVVLEVDHIIPIADGGRNDILNLVTSCFDCNRGKGKVRLNDNQTLKKQQEQIKQLAERREQIEMLMDWRRELEMFDDEQVEEFCRYFEERFNRGVTDCGKEKLLNWIREFGLLEVLDSFDISIKQYLNKCGLEYCFDYIPRICNVRRQQQNNPNIAKINYICAIARNNFNYSDKTRIKSMCAGLNEEKLEEVEYTVKRCRNWTDFCARMNTYLGGD
jgi:5-methylcytosine-specific restriction endonuclease McrA